MKCFDNKLWSFSVWQMYILMLKVYTDSYTDKTNCMLHVHVPYSLGLCGGDLQQ